MTIGSLHSARHPPRRPIATGARLTSLECDVDGSGLCAWVARYGGHANLCITVHSGAMRANMYMLHTCYVALVVRTRVHLDFVSVRAHDQWIFA